jgi:uncharacterized membrane protein
MDRALTVFIYLWVGLFVLANLVGIIGQFYLHGFSGGVSYVQEIYSPFNVINYIVMVITLFPAIGAYYCGREEGRSAHVSRNRAKTINADGNDHNYHLACVAVGRNSDTRVDNLPRRQPRDSLTD